MGNPVVEGRRALFPNMWNERIKGARRNVEVLPDLFHIVRISEDGLKEFITWKLGTLVSTARQILHLVQQLCLALNDEVRKYLPDILPCCIQVLTDAERFNDYTYVISILHTLEVFGGTLDEHMDLLFPALIRLFKVDASVEVRRGAIKTLTRLIPCVQVTGHISWLVHHWKLVLDGNKEELKKAAIDALRCLGLH
ncbi:serine/threonine-protein kinase TOR-like isoform X2 [Solanum tuberosum]|uniref:serine/threonine-protein kinase TOR-like isoform X2 n=1 Tax=Solanum tuberosum TaxID=4113 RepID=UPI000739FE0D|nr:PREDICTED: serine/threonine-protein kinase TOR-like isoform X2 [Solanum tuberosum]